MPILKAVLVLVLFMPMLGGAQMPSSVELNKTKALPSAFVAADINKDGQISREEAQKAKIPSLSFDAADKDKNGRLNLSEWTLLKF
jgi:Ca2+-binding EF-hand superfamily protein